MGLFDIFSRTAGAEDRRTERRRSGDAAEDAALKYLTRQGLKLVERNFSCKGGELDLIMQDGKSLVFVEVRRRSGQTHGGAGASVTRSKQRRLIIAAQTYLQRFSTPPACRFDVLAFEGDNMQWLKNAIEDQ
jgi:putative endonuclease